MLTYSAKIKIKILFTYKNKNKMNPKRIEVRIIIISNFENIKYKSLSFS